MIRKKRGKPLGRGVAQSKKRARSASFVGLRPSSATASRVAAKASRKTGSRCEVILCRAVRKLGLRFRTNVSRLPGCPDLVFTRERVAVFVDGDFWHGRGLAARLAKLARGHNSDYWVRKIQSNVARDKRVRRKLRAMGWHVARIWEGDIKKDPDRVSCRVVARVQRTESPRQPLILERTFGKLAVNPIAASFRVGNRTPAALANLLVRPTAPCVAPTRKCCIPE